MVVPCDVVQKEGEPITRGQFGDRSFKRNPIQDCGRSKILSTSQLKRHLMIIGHNPGLQVLGLELIGEGDPALIAALSEKLPTAGVLVITFDVKSWKDVGPRKGRLVHFATPKLLAVA